jgi:hypothetical protein
VSARWEGMKWKLYCAHKERETVGICSTKVSVAWSNFPNDLHYNGQGLCVCWTYRQWLSFRTQFKGDSFFSAFASSSFNLNVSVDYTTLCSVLFWLTVGLNFEPHIFCRTFSILLSCKLPIHVPFKVLYVPTPQVYLLSFFTCQVLAK